MNKEYVHMYSCSTIDSQDIGAVTVGAVDKTTFTLTFPDAVPAGVATCTITVYDGCRVFRFPFNVDYRWAAPNLVVMAMLEDGSTPTVNEDSGPSASGFTVDFPTDSPAETLSGIFVVTYESSLGKKLVGDTSLIKARIVSARGTPPAEIANIGTDSGAGDIILVAKPNADSPTHVEWSWTPTETDDMHRRERYFMQAYVPGMGKESFSDIKNFGSDVGRFAFPIQVTCTEDDPDTVDLTASMDIRKIKVKITGNPREEEAGDWLIDAPVSVADSSTIEWPLTYNGESFDKVEVRFTFPYSEKQSDTSLMYLDPDTRDTSGATGDVWTYFSDTARWTPRTTYGDGETEIALESKGWNEIQSVDASGLFLTAVTQSSPAADVIQLKPATGSVEGQVHTFKVGANAGAELCVPKEFEVRIRATCPSIQAAVTVSSGDTPKPATPPTQPTLTTDTPTSSNGANSEYDIPLVDWNGVTIKLDAGKSSPTQDYTHAYKWTVISMPTDSDAVVSNAMESDWWSLLKKTASDGTSDRNDAGVGVFSPSNFDALAQLSEPTSGTQAPSTTFTAKVPGTYVVKLTLSDVGGACGEVSEHTVTINVGCETPGEATLDIEGFEADQTEALVLVDPDTLSPRVPSFKAQFGVSGCVASPDITKYRWIIGEDVAYNTLSRASTAQHTWSGADTLVYDSSGAAKLTVFALDTCWRTAKRTFTVRQTCNEAASVSAYPDTSTTSRHAIAWDPAKGWSMEAQLRVIYNRAYASWQSRSGVTTEYIGKINMDTAKDNFNLVWSVAMAPATSMLAPRDGCTQRVGSSSSGVSIATVCPGARTAAVATTPIRPKDSYLGEVTLKPDVPGRYEFQLTWDDQCAAQQTVSWHIEATCPSVGFAVDAPQTEASIQRGAATSWPTFTVDVAATGADAATAPLDHVFASHVLVEAPVASRWGAGSNDIIMNLVTHPENNASDPMALVEPMLSANSAVQEGKSMVRVSDALTVVSGHARGHTELSLLHDVGQIELAKQGLGTTFVPDMEGSYVIESLVVHSCPGSTPVRRTTTLTVTCDGWPMADQPSLGDLPLRPVAARMGADSNDRVFLIPEHIRLASPDVRLEQHEVYLPDPAVDAPFARIVWDCVEAPDEARAFSSHLKRADDIGDDLNRAVALNNRHMAFHAHFTPRAEGTYKFRVTIWDPRCSSKWSSTVLVRVTCAEPIRAPTVMSTLVDSSDVWSQRDVTVFELTVPSQQVRSDMRLELRIRPSDQQLERPVIPVPPARLSEEEAAGIGVGATAGAAVVAVGVSSAAAGGLLGSWATANLGCLSLFAIFRYCRRRCRSSETTQLVTKPSSGDGNSCIATRCCRRPTAAGDAAAAAGILGILCCCCSRRRAPGSSASGPDGRMKARERRLSKPRLNDFDNHLLPSAQKWRRQSTNPLHAMMAGKQAGAAGAPPVAKLGNADGTAKITSRRASATLRTLQGTAAMMSPYAKFKIESRGVARGGAAAGAARLRGGRAREIEAQMDMELFEVTPGLGVPAGGEASSESELDEVPDTGFEGTTSPPADDEHGRAGGEGAALADAGEDPAGDAVPVGEALAQDGTTDTLVTRA
jgi:hypothetical protein